MSEAQALALALGGHKAGNQWMCRCPSHADRTASLAIKDGHSGVLVRCHAGCSFEAVSDALREAGLWGRAAGDTPRPALRPEPAQRQDLRPMARALWRGAKPWGLPYLARRGITIPIPGTVRQGGDRDAATGVHMPTMVCAITDDRREILALQRTFLTQDGARKSPITTPRKIYGSPEGGAVRLAPAGEVLGIGEGVESCLSAMQLHGVPVWAVLGAQRLAKVEIPDHVLHLRIFADHDTPGLKAAEDAAKAHHRPGRRVTIEAPPTAGSDWNDALQAMAQSEVAA